MKIGQAESHIKHPSKTKCTMKIIKINVVLHAKQILNNLIWTKAELKTAAWPTTNPPFGVLFLQCIYQETLKSDQQICEFFFQSVQKQVLCHKDIQQYQA